MHGSSHLEIAQLSKLFPAVVQQTGEWLGMLVCDFMGTDIAALGKPLLTYIARERFLASMTSLMGLFVSTWVRICLLPLA